jgi:hypothetical protein
MTGMKISRVFCSVLLVLITAGVAWADTCVGIISKREGSASRGCTLIGCTDGFAMTVGTPRNRWPSGNHEVILGIDDKRTTCRFAWYKDSTGQFPSYAIASCEPSEAEIRITVEPVRICNRDVDRGVIAVQCHDVPDEFVEKIAIGGTPRRLSIVQRVDGKVIGERTVEPTYKDVQPNGAGCEPTCRQAMHHWTIEAQTTDRAD